MTGFRGRSEISSILTSDFQSRMSTNRNKPATARATHAFSNMVGLRVRLTAKGNAVYEGVFCGYEGDQLLLKQVKEIPSAARPSGAALLAEMLFHQNSVLTMSSLESNAKFQVDSEISAKRSTAEKELVHWKSEAAASTEGALEDSMNRSGSATWDQFEANKKLYNVKTTYSEELYTTPLDVSRLTKQQQEKAARLALEIETGRSYGGKDLEVEGDEDEEAKFSAVQGTGGYANIKPLPEPSKNAYVPPSQRSASTSAWKQGSGLTSDASKPGVETKKAMPASPATMSEMRNVNALNLEPALSRSRNDDARNSRPTTAPPRELKREFETFRDELNTRVNKKQATPTGPSTVMMAAAQSAQSAVAPPPQMSPDAYQRKRMPAPPTSAPLAPAAAPPSVPVAAPPAPPKPSSFQFNPNASSFTFNANARDFTPVIPAPASTQNTLNIVITPGGSLSGSLKGSNYDDPHLHQQQPVQQPPVVMVMPQHHGSGPMMVMPYPPQYHHNMPIQSQFIPFCSAEELQEIGFSQDVETHAVGSWEEDTDIDTYKQILGSPIVIMPMMHMYPHPMMYGPPPPFVPRGGFVSYPPRYGGQRRSPDT
jgi:LsmAD domain